MSLISDIKDQNIFHIFAFDIIKYYDSKYKKVIIDSSRLDLENSCQKWRYFVLKKLYESVEYADNTTYKNKPTHKDFIFSKFIKNGMDPHVKKIYDIISSKNEGKYILLNQRNSEDRYLYDYNTKIKLEDYLSSQDLKLPLRVCNFGIMTPEEQYEICANCAVFISAHGAGCTNLIFTPPKTPLIEVNFRKHWYCDPVCDDHFDGVISPNEKCNGKLCYHPIFHKADYHNLCYFIDKPYLEIEAQTYGRGFSSRNPISKRRIYIHGDNIVSYINVLDLMGYL